VRAVGEQQRPLRTQHADAIVIAEPQRALDEPDPLPEIAQLTDRIPPLPC